MKHCLLIFIILFSLLTTQAANSVYTLSGKITDEAGVPVTYATVSLDNAKYVSAANQDGEFSIKLPIGEYSGKVSAVGYKAYEFKVTIDSDTVLDIVLEEDVINLKGVNVYGKSTAKRLEEGAFAVNAVEITPNVNKLVTLNDIVDHTAGVKVRREGGMGSEFDLTINGMSGNSIRYFIDGVPLETKGTGLTLENVPLNTVERVELYKGVVPSYLSSDALGGAVNIVTKKVKTKFFRCLLRYCFIPYSYRRPNGTILHTWHFYCSKADIQHQLLQKRLYDERCRSLERRGRQIYLHR